VALESTIITHGMPYPGNIEMARSVESIIREQGAVPATIAVIHGTLHIGLEAEQLEQLAQAKDVLKVSRADLAFAIAERRHRRHHGCRHDDRRRARRHQGVRNRRHRRRASRR
jgi:pseudouridine-5'-phosphate glycosidase